MVIGVIFKIKLGSNQIQEAKNLKRINNELLIEENEGAKSLIVIVKKEMLLIKEMMVY